MENGFMTNLMNYKGKTNMSIKEIKIKTSQEKILRILAWEGLLQTSMMTIMNITTTQMEGIEKSKAGEID